MRKILDLNTQTGLVYVRKKKEKKSQFLEMIDRLYLSPSNVLSMDGSLGSIYEDFFSRLSRRKNTWKRVAFKRLVIHLYNERCFMVISKKYHLDVVFRMSNYGNRMVREIEGWKREGLNEEDQLRSLIKYCFELYPTADFLRETLFTNNKRHIKWYLDLAIGKPVFNLEGFPKDFTKKMAHAFTNIKDIMPVDEALVTARIKSLGANVIIERLLFNSFLARGGIDFDSFWIEVLTFFSKFQFIEHNQFYYILDFLQHIKHADPKFSIKGRTLASLTRLSQEWHRDVYIQAHKDELLTWKPQPVEDYVFVEETSDVDSENKTYTIKELCSSLELFEEGNTMGHCVASYDRNCKRGASAIFSLAEFTNSEEEKKRLVTMEVNPKGKEVVQIRAKYNEEPPQSHLEIIKDWANTMNYTISTYAL